MNVSNSFSGYVQAFRVIQSSYKGFVPGFILVSLVFVLVSILGAIVPWFLKQATNAFTMDRGIPARKPIKNFFILYAILDYCREPDRSFSGFGSLAVM